MPQLNSGPREEVLFTACLFIRAPLRCVRVELTHRSLGLVPFGTSHDTHSLAPAAGASLVY